MRWLLPVALGCLVLSGCGDAEPPQSPADVVRSYLTAFDQRDLATLRRLTGGSELADAFHRWHSVATDFKRRMISEYGEEGWEDLVDGESFSMSFTSPSYVDEDLTSLPEDIRGDTAVVSLPDGRRQSLKRTDGRWQLDFDKDFNVRSGAAIGAGAITYWRSFTELLESNLPLIGKKGVTPDTLDAKMSKEFLAMLKNAK